MTKPVAIGDIHGCLDLLNKAIEAFPHRKFVFLGDIIDRGPESRACVDRVRGLVQEGRAVVCLGNHDLFMIEAVLDGQNPEVWFDNGGGETLRSYGNDGSAINADALWLDDNLKPWHVEGGILFAHAMRPDLTSRNATGHLWGRPSNTPAYPLPEGVTVSVHGHTVVEFPVAAEVSDGTIMWFIDTGAVFVGKLTALDCETFQTTTFTEEKA